MIRTTLNGLQPRESRELDRNPYDWFDGPMFDPPQDLDATDLVILVIGIVSAVLVLAFKFGGGA